MSVAKVVRRSRSAKVTSSSLKSSSSSINDTNCSSWERKVLNWRLKAPRIWFIATWCEARDCEAITSAIASAWERSSLPFANARWVNSPPVAARHPASMRVLTICCWIHNEPWHEISTTSSPVNEFGARNNVSTASSRSSPCESIMWPRWAVWLAISLNDLPCHRCCTMSRASSPLTLITAIPPMPWGVDTAQIVSMYSLVVIRWSLFGLVPLVEVEGTFNGILHVVG